MPWFVKYFSRVRTIDQQLWICISQNFYHATDVSLYLYFVAHWCDRNDWSLGRHLMFLKTGLKGRGKGLLSNAFPYWQVKLIFFFPKSWITYQLFKKGPPPFLPGTQWDNRWQLLCTFQHLCLEWKKIFKRKNLNTSYKRNFKKYSYLKKHILDLPDSHS